MSDRGPVTLYGNGANKPAEGHVSAAPAGPMQLAPVATDSRPQQLSDLEAGSREAIALVKMHTTAKELVEQRQRHPTRQQQRLTPASWLEASGPQTSRSSSQVARDLNNSLVTERPGAENYGAHTSSAPQTPAQIVRLRSEGLVSLDSGFALRQQLKGLVSLDSGFALRSSLRALATVGRESKDSCDLNLVSLASLQASFYAEVCWRMLTYADVC